MVFLLHGNFFAPLLNFASDIGSGFSQVQNIANLGGGGPAAFFCASGFVLSLVWQKSKSDGFLRFALRRYIRLMPLYFFVLLFFSYNSYRVEKDIFDIVRDLVSRALFLEVFSYQQFNSLPMIVMWTIGVEFWLSMMIPILVAIFTSPRYSEIGLFSVLSLSAFAPILMIKLGVIDLMAFKSVPACLSSFALGVFSSTLKPSIELHRVFRVLGVISSVFFLMYIWSGFIGAWWISILLSFCYLGVNRTSTNTKSQNGFFLWFGTICYGLYLIHMPLIQITSRLSEDYSAILAFIPLLVLSSFSWLFLERPMILFFNRKLKKSNQIRK